MADVTCTLELSLGIKYCLEFSFYHIEAPKKEVVIIMERRPHLIHMKIEEIQARYPHWHLRSNAFIDDPHLKSPFQYAILLILLIISENTVRRGGADIGNAYQTTTTLASFTSFHICSQPSNVAGGLTSNMCNKTSTVSSLKD
jgi:hypothetical protein